MQQEKTSTAICAHCNRGIDRRDETGQKKRPLRCSSCKIVFYCNTAHQKHHWKAHKKFCNEVKLGFEATAEANIGIMCAKKSTRAIGSWLQKYDADIRDAGVISCFLEKKRFQVYMLSSDLKLVQATNISQAKMQAVYPEQCAGVVEAANALLRKTQEDFGDESGLFWFAILVETESGISDWGVYATTEAQALSVPRFAVCRLMAQALRSYQQLKARHINLIAGYLLEFRDFCKSNFNSS